MSRFLILTFGVLSYLIFFATFLAMIGFTSGLFAPFDAARPVGEPLFKAWLINAGVVLLFGLQHSVMARPAFKRVLTKVFPQAAERSLYVLASSLALVLMLMVWRPIGGGIWAAESDALRYAVLALQGLGWLTVLYSTLLIDHFDLFGLRQVLLHFMKRPYTERAFRTPSLYAHVRHPIYLGWMVVLWAAPTMSVDRLILAGLSTAYILVAIVFEERDLRARFGKTYDDYKQRVPSVLPRLRLRRTAAEPAEAA